MQLLRFFAIDFPQVHTFVLCLQRTNLSISYRQTKSREGDDFTGYSTVRFYEDTNKTGRY